METIIGKTECLGNNETRSFGVFKNSQGYLAMTRTQSKWFKTESGAIKWLKKTAPELFEELTTK